MSSAYIKRVSDNTNIPFTGLQLSTDEDSWAWSFRAGIRTKATLDLVRPSGAGPVEIEVTVNGETWRILVEGFSRSSAFADSSYTIVGRSLSAELAAPYQEKTTFMQGATQISAVQLANDQLTGIAGWNGGSQVVWDTVDWLLPGYTFSSENQTPLENILKLAKAVGGVIEPSRNSRLLTIRAKYPHSPWQWATTTEDLVIPAGVSISTGSNWRPNPLHNAVYVAGSTANGVMSRVYQTGTAGDKYLQMVVDPLVTDLAMAAEKGRNLLAETGNREDVSLEMPIFISPDQPGLVLPGTFLKVAGDQDGDWMGKSTGITVTAALNGKALIVRQNVAVERYHG